MRTGPADPLSITPIGFVTSPHRERQTAPRQPAAARGVGGTITLFERTGIAHALEDLACWSHLWVIFWFHFNAGFRPKVAPPRSAQKRGVFSTRAPYRPNPIGLSLVRLQRVEGRVVHILDVDILDGTPVLDIKPYVAYADVAGDASDGWLPAAADPAPRYQVAYAELAREQLAFLAAAGVDWLTTRAEEVLSLGPTPHPYRRIRADGDAMRVALKDFRMRFTCAGQVITVTSVHSGYTSRALSRPGTPQKGPTPLSVHREFVARF